MPDYPRRRHPKKQIREGVILFREGGRYKWSRKFPHCRKCGKVDHPHHGRGLCSLCFERGRVITPRRVAQRRKAGGKYYRKNLKKLSKKCLEYYYKNRDEIQERKRLLYSLKKNKGVEFVIGRLRIRSPFPEVPENYANDFFHWRKKVEKHYQFLEKKLFDFSDKKE